MAAKIAYDFIKIKTLQRKITRTYSEYNKDVLKCLWQQLKSQEKFAYDTPTIFMHMVAISEVTLQNNPYFTETVSTLRKIVLLVFV